MFYFFWLDIDLVVCLFHLHDDYSMSILTAVDDKGLVEGMTLQEKNGRTFFLCISFLINTDAFKVFKCIRWIRGKRESEKDNHIIQVLHITQLQLVKCCYCEAIYSFIGIISTYYRVIRKVITAETKCTGGGGGLLGC